MIATSEALKDSIRNIGVLGTGQMGAAAAVMFQRAGFHVKLWNRSAEKLHASKTALQAVDDFLTRHLGPSHSKAELLLEPDLGNVDATSDALLECVSEEMAQKTELLRRLHGSRERGALIMSCTSALSITEMARGSGLESVLVGAHFWNPPHLIPVVEIVAGRDTSPRQVERATALMQQAGKLPVHCADVPGFIGNRLMHAMWREALAMVDAGVCSAEAIDQVVKWSFALRLPALGPMENMDLVGLSLVESVQRYLLPDLAANTIPAKALTTRLNNGDTGMKSGRGFYDWSMRDAAAVVALRDQQIVRQLEFLREQGVFPSTIKPST
ncbi:MAG: 3-hydroxyacyl-CoA dehydrogenase [Chthoniobacteraceae bacterium]|nr:3-hydroxyacyl-CoA dehydrogenase [Chthoniobacteraceae bacterium]